MILRRRWDKGKYMKPMSKNQERRPLGVDPEYTLLDSMVKQENKIYFWYSESETQRLRDAWVNQ